MLICLPDTFCKTYSGFIKKLNKVCTKKMCVPSISMEARPKLDFGVPSFEKGARPEHGSGVPIGAFSCIHKFYLDMKEPIFDPTIISNSFSGLSATHTNTIINTLYSQIDNDRNKNNVSALSFLLFLEELRKGLRCTDRIKNIIKMSVIKCHPINTKIIDFLGKKNLEYLKLVGGLNVSDTKKRNFVSALLRDENLDVWTEIFVDHLKRNRNDDEDDENDIEEMSTGMFYVCAQYFARNDARSVIAFFPRRYFTIKEHSDHFFTCICDSFIGMANTDTQFKKRTVEILRYCLKQGHKMAAICYVKYLNSTDIKNYSELDIFLEIFCNLDKEKQKELMDQNTLKKYAELIKSFTLAEGIMVKKFLTINYNYFFDLINLIDENTYLDRKIFSSFRKLITDRRFYNLGVLISLSFIETVRYESTSSLVILFNEILTPSISERDLKNNDTVKLYRDEFHIKISEGYLRKNNIYSADLIWYYIQNYDYTTVKKLIKKNEEGSISWCDDDFYITYNNIGYYYLEIEYNVDEALRYFRIILEAKKDNTEVGFIKIAYDYTIVNLENIIKNYPDRTFEICEIYYDCTGEFDFVNGKLTESLKRQFCIEKNLIEHLAQEDRVILSVLDSKKLDPEKWIKKGTCCICYLEDQDVYRYDCGIEETHEGHSFCKLCTMNLRKCAICRRVPYFLK